MDDVVASKRTIPNDSFCGWKCVVANLPKSLYVLKRSFLRAAGLFSVSLLGSFIPEPLHSDCQTHHSPHIHGSVLNTHSNTLAFIHPIINNQIPIIGNEISDFSLIRDLFLLTSELCNQTPSSGSWGSPHMFKGIMRSNGGMLAWTHACYLYNCVVGYERPECGHKAFIFFLFLSHMQTHWAILHLHQADTACDAWHKMVTACHLGLQ